MEWQASKGKTHTYNKRKAGLQANQWKGIDALRRQGQKM